MVFSKFVSLLNSDSNHIWKSQSHEYHKAIFCDNMTMPQYLLFLFRVSLITYNIISNIHSFFIIFNVFSALYDEHFKTDKKVRVELMNQLLYSMINQLVWNLANIIGSGKSILNMFIWAYTFNKNEITRSFILICFIYNLNI